MGKGSTRLVYVKEHWWGTDHVIAICDQELLGKTLVERNIRFFIDPNFYEGKLMPVSEAVKLIHNYTIANLVGKNIVEAAINEGLIDPEAVIEINGVPHAQIVKIFK